MEYKDNYKNNFAYFYKIKEYVLCNEENKEFLFNLAPEIFVENDDNNPKSTIQSDLPNITGEDND